MENILNAAANDNQTSSPTPRPGERWIVQRPGYRCLATRDIAGKWRDIFDHNELPDVIEAVQIY